MSARIRVKAVSARYAEDLAVAINGALDGVPADSFLDLKIASAESYAKAWGSEKAPLFLAAVIYREDK